MDGKSGKIPDGIYRIRNGHISVPIKNYNIQPYKVPDKITFEEIELINTINKTTLQETSYLKLDRLNEFMKITNLNTREDIRKIIITHQEAFTLRDDPLPCTNLTEHEIILKSGRVINLRSHKLPEKHREFSHEETQKLLQKAIIRHSQSQFYSPLWIVPKKGNKLRMSAMLEAGILTRNEED